MAFRTPICTIIMLILTCGLYCLCFWFPEVVKYERDGFKADVGLVRYVVHSNATASAPTTAERDWVFTLDCAETEKPSDCKVYKYASIVVGILVIMSFLSLLAGTLYVVCGAGTTLTLFALSFFMGFASLILYMAVYSKMHLPPPTTTPLELDDFLINSTTAVPPTHAPSRFNDTHGLTFGVVFYVYIGAVVFNFATILQHWSTRGRRYMEEI